MRWMSTYGSYHYPFYLLECVMAWPFVVMALAIINEVTLCRTVDPVSTEMGNRTPYAVLIGM